MAPSHQNPKGRRSDFIAGVTIGLTVGVLIIGVLASVGVLAV